MSLELAGILVTSGLVPSTVIDDALRRQVLTGGTLDLALLEAGVTLREADCLRALVTASGLPGADGSVFLAADPAALALLPAKLATRHCLLPLKLEGRVLDVAVRFPPQRATLDEIGFLLGKELRPRVALEARLWEAISHYYRLPLQPRYSAVVAVLGALPFAALPPLETPPAAPTAPNAPVAPPPAAEPAPEVVTAPPPEPDAPRERAESAAGPEATEARPEAPSAAEAHEDPFAEDAHGESAESEPGYGFALSRCSNEGLVWALESVLEGGELPVALKPASPPAPDEGKAKPEHAKAPGSSAREAGLEQEQERNPALAQLKRQGGPRADATGGATAAATKAAPPRRKAPRNRVDVVDLARKIAAAAGGKLGADAQPRDSWTPEKMRAALDEAGDRDQMIRAALRCALKDFDFAAAFALVGGAATGWAALGREGAADERVEGLSIPLHVPSVLRTVFMARCQYLGPLPEDEVSQSLLDTMARPASVTALVVPVEVRDRAVALLYCDRADGAVADGAVAEMIILAHQFGRRVERFILEQKRKLAEAALPAPAQAPAPAEAAVAPASGFALESPAESAAELFARSPLRETSGSGARFARELPAAMPVTAPGVSRALTVQAGSQAEKAPLALPPMDELFLAADRLVGTDAALRAKALADLTRAPEVAAAVLAARFPGPLMRARVPVSRLPEAEELGPVPGAMARLGLPAARALIPLLEHRDPDVRYVAILTAGRLRYAILAAPLAQRVYERNPAIASAARAALVNLSDLPQFEQTQDQLRASLNARDPEAAASAARALGQLHDIGVVERLIELTGGDNKGLAEACADALRDICKQTFGVNTRKWSGWWQENRNRPRIDWLIDGLRHADLDIRLLAIDELTELANDNFGYYADGPLAERDSSVKRWESWRHELAATG